MNYYSHFVVSPTQNNGYVTLGSILPDMLRNAKSELVSIVTEQSNNECFARLIDGMINHIEVDRKFHNSEFFIRSNSQYAALLRKNEHISMVKYTQFYAHILIELLIDHVLIKTDKEHLITFYRLLEDVDERQMSSFFKDYFPSQDFELFWERFQKFLTRKFLLEYDDIDRVIEFSFLIYEKTTKQRVDRLEHNHHKTLIKLDLLPEIEQYARNLLGWLTNDNEN